MKNILKITAVFRILILFICVFSGQVGGQESARDFSDEKIEIFEQVWSIINEKYYDKNFNGVDWKVVGESYRPLINETKTEEEFYALLDKMAGELCDSHTRGFSPKGIENRKNHKSVGIGISLGKIEDSFAVTEVLQNSEAARAGVKAGMIVRSIDDFPVDEAFAKAQVQVGASSSERSAQLRAFSKMTAGEMNSLLKLELIDFEGKIFEVDLTRQIISKNPQFIEKLLPSGLIYIKFAGFDVDTANKIEKTLRKNKKATGLILDLRGNRGGDGDAGLRVAGYFFNERILVARLLTRTGKPPIPEIPLEIYAGAKGKRIFSKPLVILTDEKTASVSELITDALQSYHRAYIIGTQTCGCVLGFIDYKQIKGGGDLSVSEFGFVTAKGRRLEGDGVVPDKIILPTLKDLRDGRDAVLEEAEKFLINSSKK